MQRILLVGVEDAIVHAVSARLRNGTCLTCGTTLPSPDDWDAAAFATPDAVLIERCLKAGKHVQLAAPSCLPRETLVSLAAVAHQVGVQLAVLNPDCYLPSIEAIWQKVEAGSLGEPGLVRIHRWESCATFTAAIDPFPGALMRALDLAITLMRRRPNLVFATSAASRAFVQVHLGYPGGGMALIDYTGSLPAGDPYQSLALIGSAGAAYADDHLNMQLVYRGGTPQALRIGEEAKQLAAMLQALVDAVPAKRTAPMADWRTTYTVAEAARGSIATGQAVPVEGR